ncbi:hypothetical protein FBEOM_9444 [Fusarium beomiforme]|uniref:Uncharacterized protein n=1 Tax=Fusarium beomiforme TaxID=44412 RepID=A0A9P5AEB9_9HYPO|nr:hypothetical protein FBEOM_9444 [Fusarium beomiforme]
MTTFTAEAFTFLSSIKTPAIEGGLVRTRLLFLLDNLQAPNPQEFIEWTTMPEFRAFAFDNLKVEFVKTWSGYRTEVSYVVIFLRLGEWIAKMLEQDSFGCKFGDSHYQCPSKQIDDVMDIDGISNACDDGMESVDDTWVDDVASEVSLDPWGI